MAKRTTRPAPVKIGIGQTNDIFNGSIPELLSSLNEVIENFPSKAGEILNRSFHCNISDIDHAKELIYNGCPNLLSKYLKHSDSLNIKPYLSSNPVYMPANEGLFFSVPAYLEGIPEHWVNLEYEEETNKITDLYINMSASYKISEEQIFEKLINVVKYIDQNEASGNRLNIYIVFNCKPLKDVSDQTKLNFKVKIKHESEPVNIQQIVYLVASPVLLRFAFMLLNCKRVEISEIGSYYQDQESEIQCLGRSDIVYIPSFYYDKSHYISDYNNLTEVYPHLN